MLPQPSTPLPVTLPAHVVFAYWASYLWFHWIACLFLHTLKNFQLFLTYFFPFSVIIFPRVHSFLFYYPHSYVVFHTSTGIRQIFLNISHKNSAAKNACANNHSMFFPIQQLFLLLKLCFPGFFHLYSLAVISLQISSDNTRTQIKFGIAINPLQMSDRFQTICSGQTQPTNATNPYNKR